jgi:hypothetical protein
VFLRHARPLRSDAMAALLAGGLALATASAAAFTLLAAPASAPTPLRGATTDRASSAAEPPEPASASANLPAAPGPDGARRSVNARRPPHQVPVVEPQLSSSLRRPGELEDSYYSRLESLRRYRDFVDQSDVDALQERQVRVVLADLQRNVVAAGNALLEQLIYDEQSLNASDQDADHAAVQLMAKDAHAQIARVLTPHQLAVFDRTIYSPFVLVHSRPFDFPCTDEI